MKTEIDRLFSATTGPHLMTHAVAGYPDAKRSYELMARLAESGADVIEIQIPFSDPMADGPTIMAACHQALGSGMRVETALRLASRVKRATGKPVALMTYGNIPFRMGMRRFVAEAQAAGVSGLIVPDLSIDEAESAWTELAASSGICAIPVVSPVMTSPRLAAVLKQASGFIYTTLRVGTTGAGRTIDPAALAFIGTLRRASRLPIAAGFGISRPEHAAQLRRHADMVIVGSHLIDLYNCGGTKAVTAFVRGLHRVLQEK